MEFIITDRIPVEAPRDKYIVEITTNNEHTEEQSRFEVGGFERREDGASLQALIELLNTMAEMARTAEEDEKYDYSDVLGFHQWFTPSTTMEDFETSYSYLLKEQGREAVQRSFNLSKGFETEWPKDTNHGFHDEMIDHYKVFYYDISGAKHNVEIRP